MFAKLATFPYIHIIKNFKNNIDTAVCNAENNPCVHGTCKVVGTEGTYKADCQPCDEGWTGDKCDQSK